MKLKEIFVSPDYFRIGYDTYSSGKSVEDVMHKYDIEKDSIAYYNLIGGFNVADVEANKVNEEG